MSKGKGNFLTLNQAIDNFSADGKLKTRAFKPNLNIGQAQWHVNLYSVMMKLHVYVKWYFLQLDKEVVFCQNRYLILQ